MITQLEKNTTQKKQGSVVWSSVGAQNTKHNRHRHNNQQDEPRRKKLRPEKKKVQSSGRWLKCMFFGGFKLQPEKFRPKKKRYSRLADG